MMKRSLNVITENSLLNAFSKSMSPNIGRVCSKNMRGLGPHTTNGRMKPTSRRWQEMK